MLFFPPLGKTVGETLIWAQQIKLLYSQPLGNLFQLSATIYTPKMMYCQQEVIQSVSLIFAFDVRAVSHTKPADRLMSLFFPLLFSLLHFIGMCLSVDLQLQIRPYTWNI